jgi:hypothetical protein
MRFFTSGFFHESVSLQPQGIALGPFQIFSNISGDIRKSRCTGVFNTGGKFAASVVETSGKFPQVSLPQVSMTPVENNGNNIRLLRP